MRDAGSWSASLDPTDFVDDPSGWQEDKIADLIRDAQEDGAKVYKRLYKELVARYAALFPEGS